MKRNGNYRRQTKVAKVIFLHLSVILFTRRVSASVHAGIHPAKQNKFQTPPSGADTPSSTVHAGRYGQQAGGTLATGMHTCFNTKFSVENVSRWEVLQFEYTQKLKGWIIFLIHVTQKYQWPLPFDNHDTLFPKPIGVCFHGKTHATTLRLSFIWEIGVRWKDGWSSNFLRGPCNSFTYQFWGNFVTLMKLKLILPRLLLAKVASSCLGKHYALS